MSQLFNFHSMTVLIIVASLILITAGFSHADKKVVATVNGVAIKQTELTAEVNKKLPLASYHARVSNEKLQEFRNQALQNLIEDELLYQEAKRQKLEVKQIELQLRMKMMKDGYASENDFQQAVAKAGLNILSFMEHIERRLLIEKIQQKEIIAKVQVTDSDLQEYFETNKSKFIQPPRFRVRHILISVAPGAMTAGWQAGLEKAQQTYTRIIAGEDFAALATRLSADSSSRAAGGDIGWFHKGQLLPELDEQLQGMQVGEVSQPIRSIYGFHLLRLEGEQPEKQLTFDEISHQALKKKLTKKRIEARRQEYLMNLKTQSDIRIFEQ